MLYSEGLGKDKPLLQLEEGISGEQQVARTPALGTKSAGVGPKSEPREDAITVPHGVLLLLILGVCVLQEQADGVSQLGETAEVRDGGLLLRDRLSLLRVTPKPPTPPHTPT